MGARRLGRSGTVNGVSVICSVEASAWRRRTGTADGAALIHTLINRVVEAACRRRRSRETAHEIKTRAVLVRRHLQLHHHLRPDENKNYLQKRRLIIFGVVDLEMSVWWIFKNLTWGGVRLIRYLLGLLVAIEGSWARRQGVTSVTQPPTGPVSNTQACAEWVARWCCSSSSSSSKSVGRFKDKSSKHKKNRFWCYFFLKNPH